MKKYLLLLALLALPLAAQAASVLNLPFTYEDGRLRAGQPTVDTQAYLSSDEFDAASAVSQGRFRLYISDMYDKELVSYRFEPNGAAFTLQVPYYSTVKQLSVSAVADASSVATLDLQNLATCFPNNVCEYEKGETEISCLPDCGVATPRFSAATRAFLAERQGVYKDSTGAILLEERGTPTATWLWPLIGGGLLAALAILAVILYVKKRPSQR